MYNLSFISVLSFLNVIDIQQNAFWVTVIEFLVLKLFYVSKQPQKLKLLIETF